jgi:splicing factor 3A subunit 3
MCLEIERERLLAEAPVEGEESEEDEDEAKLANPLNLPLGWDGKPIPFWLYKLHGLNIEYVFCTMCDLCDESVAARNGVSGRRVKWSGEKGGQVKR